MKTSVKSDQNYFHRICEDTESISSQIFEWIFELYKWGVRFICKFDVNLVVYGYWRKLRLGSPHLRLGSPHLPLLLLQLTLPYPPSLTPPTHSPITPPLHTRQSSKTFLFHILHFRQHAHGYMFSKELWKIKTPPSNNKCK